MNSTADGVNNSTLSLAYRNAERGANKKDLAMLQDMILASGTNRAYEDVAVLAFHTRDVRGGKGERDVFYMMIDNLLKYDFDLVVQLMELVPEYGSWMDIIHFKSVYTKFTAFQYEINKMILKQLLADEKALQSGNTSNISLLGKWLPREGNKYDLMAKELALFIWENDIDNRVATNYMQSYRKRLSALNRVLKTVETFECANRWDEIDPKTVPNRALEIKKHAYLNEKVYRYNPYRFIRHVNNDKRNKCRENFKEYFAIPRKYNSISRPDESDLYTERYAPVRKLVSEWSEGGWRTV